MTFAFPVATIDNHVNEGMTLRQWYAGLAMQGFIAHKGNFSVVEAYEAADALIKGGEK